MLKQDAITIEILPDGTIKTTTDPISSANHSNAEQFLSYLAKLAGGATERRSKGKSLHSHDHSHLHDHDHDAAKH